MPATTFSARVVNGLLDGGEALKPFEGQQVSVTVIGPTTPTEPKDGGVLKADESDCEPPEWMDVETDVYVKMLGKVEVLDNVQIVDCGPGHPCLIFPEESADE